jgi:hypothetical protein
MFEMNFLTSFLLFVFVFFVYIHIIHQYKKSQDLEIYELTYKNNENLQETCDVRQPVVFLLDYVLNEEQPNILPIHLDTIESILKQLDEEKEEDDDNIESPTLHVKDTFDYYTANSSQQPPPPPPLPPTEVALTFSSTMQLIKTDSQIHYFTENNHSFLEEIGVDNVLNKIGNAYLKPAYSVIQRFDVMTGTNQTELPLRYHTNTRKYLQLTNGKILVKMTPFYNCKKLKVNKNKYSNINVWNPQKEYISIVNKTRFLEFNVIKGHVLYIPPYWLYSIKYVEDNTSIVEYNYQTCMNVLAYPNVFIQTTMNKIYNIIETYYPKNVKKINPTEENTTEDNEKIKPMTDEKKIKSMENNNDDNIKMQINEISIN